MSDVMASGVAQLFRDHVWKLHGLLEEVISDQGTQFMLMDLVFTEKDHSKDEKPDFNGAFGNSGAR